VQIGILESTNFSEHALKKLRHAGRVELYKKQKLSSFLKDKEVLFVRLGHKINKKFLKLAPRLQWLCSPTTGLNHLDEKELKRKNIKLLSLRGEKHFLKTIHATPEHTLGLILTLLRRYPLAFSSCRSSFWDRDRFRGEELHGNRVGIIGLGRVGHRVATLCQAFGARIFWYDPAKVKHPSEWKRLPSPASVIRASKIIVLSAAHVANQKPILGKREIQCLKQRYFINTSRGELVDENSLFDAIRKNYLRGAALDVLKNENRRQTFKLWRPLLGKKNFFLTPHLGGATNESMAKTENFIVDILLTHLKRRLP